MCVIILGPWPQTVRVLPVTSVVNAISEKGFKTVNNGKRKSNSKRFFYRKPLIATVEKQLLGEHLTAILQKGNLSSL